MKIIFKGVVQGVGFRPTIYRIAKKLALKGYVLNKGSEVEVVIDKSKDEFIKEVNKNLPDVAKITNITILKDNRTFNDFKILHSKKGEKKSIIPVDISICDDCLEELFDKKNKRHLFPFTNCTVCGARFSVITDVPYDRERTSMDAFKLCRSCENEYNQPLNRRYHAQTISCPICGPVYKLYDKQKKDLGEKDAIKRFASKIDIGKIGVIKSWGGMHLCCKIDEINHFRKWYNRPQKAFAVMVKDIKTAEKYGQLTKDEKQLLLSKNKPVVLVKKKNVEEISPGLNTIGLYLPYTGLHHLLFSYLKSDSLIMTSANLPGEPMIIKNSDAFSLGADVYLLHNRDIPNRIDDSVVRLWKGHNFFIRKSRGFVPEPISVSYNNRILSVGAGENICGAISNDKFVYSTQYIGNSRYYDVLEFLEHALRHLMKITMEKQGLDAIAQDMHPGYDSRKVATKFSDEFKVPIFDVQHHFAHAVSLLVDRSIDECIVLTVDGLGFGDDGNYWGGEVLYSSKEEYKRVGHLENITLLGGDQAAIDPRRLVFAIFKKFGKEKFFEGNEAANLSKMMNKSPKTSSFGRVLDALSCYLNICTKRTYDGEPAMKLEKYLAVGENKYSFDTQVKNGIIDNIDLFRQLDERISKNPKEKEKADFAYSFVKSIVDKLTELAIESAENEDIKNIGITGGVSYNIPIVEMVEKKVKQNNLNFVVHNQIPNGDGGIAIGQNVIIGNKIH